MIVPPAGEQLPGAFEVSVADPLRAQQLAVLAVEEGSSREAFVRPHIHSNDVWVYVLTGEVGVLVGEEIAIAGGGVGAQTSGCLARDVERRDRSGRIIEAPGCPAPDGRRLQ